MEEAVKRKRERRIITPSQTRSTGEGEDGPQIRVGWAEWC
jgi:hypothetical protein